MIIMFRCIVKIRISVGQQRLRDVITMSAIERRPLLTSTNNNLRNHGRQRGTQYEQSSNIYSLIANLNIYDKIFLLVLLLLFFLGVIVGCYLIATEGHEWRTPGVYNVTSREFWKAQVSSSAIPKLTLPVQRVLLLQTNDTHVCSNISHCTKILQEIQLEHMFELNQPDIIYNFVVSQDGSIFEGRGWSYQNSLSNSSLALAFLGQKNLTEKQIESTKLFLYEAVRAGDLTPCVNVSSEKRSFTQTARDIQEVVSNCDI